MVGRNVIEVTETATGDWSVERSGKPETRSIFRQQPAALDAARELAQTAPPSKIVITTSGGMIDREILFGDEPDLADFDRP